VLLMTLKSGLKVEREVKPPAAQPVEPAGNLPAPTPQPAEPAGNLPAPAPQHNERPPRPAQQQPRARPGGDAARKAAQKRKK
jgi:hypothetical protein